MDMEIRNIKKIKGDSVRVNIALNTPNLGTIVIKGFRVGRSPKFEGIWVQPPSFNIFGNYHKMCFFEDTKIWESVESYLIEAFSHFEEEHPEEFLNLDKIDSEIGGGAYS